MGRNVKNNFVESRMPEWALREYSQMGDCAASPRGLYRFVVILFSAVKIIVAGKPTAEGEEKGAVISAVCPPLSKG